MHNATLYERLGGDVAIRRAVEVFYQKVLGDARLAPFFKNIDLDRLYRHQAAFLSQVTGGPKMYSGRGMAQAHARLAITQRDFDAVAYHLTETLHELNAPEEVIGELVSAVASLSPQIVTRSEAAPESAGPVEIGTDPLIA